MSVKIDRGEPDDGGEAKIDMTRLFPDLTADEQTEAAYFFARFLEIVWKIARK